MGKSVESAALGSSQNMSQGTRRFQDTPLTLLNRAGRLSLPLYARRAPRVGPCPPDSGSVIAADAAPHRLEYTETAGKGSPRRLFSTQPHSYNGRHPTRCQDPIPAQTVNAARLIIVEHEIHGTAARSPSRAIRPRALRSPNRFRSRCLQPGHRIPTRSRRLSALLRSRARHSRLRGRSRKAAALLQGPERSWAGPHRPGRGARDGSHCSCLRATRGRRRAGARGPHRGPGILERQARRGKVVAWPA